ncbi:MAG: hypothetical protein A4E55_00517 [Pelotomaculum sp. PtaU1.Bin035]|nr:MAG: hypothetical protein A4E55_00517 [Pelotomaculum sp. PtaU1.Bin035]
MKVPVRRQWRDRLEQGLIRLVAAAAGLLVIVQALMVNGPLKQVSFPLAFQVWRQSDLINPPGVLHSPLVTLQINNFSSLPLARVLVNGEPRGEFYNRYVTVFVRGGDILEVDGARCNQPFNIEVLNVSEEVGFPVCGMEIKVDRHVGRLGKVQLKDK